MSRVELFIHYQEDGTEKTRTVVNKWKFQDAMMGEQFITFNITSEKPIDWAVGDYCIFRGETFTLNYVPSVTQKARTNERQDAYTYENVKLESNQEELTRIIMLDITPTTGDYIAALGTNHTGSSRFSLFCGEASANGSTFTAVCALAAKIQANLDRAYPGAWHIYVDTEHTFVNASGKTVLITHTEDKVVSFDNTTVAQALAEVHNTFDLDYCVRGRNIYIGYRLKNLTTDNDGYDENDEYDISLDETFAFGYGKGYPTRDNAGKALFQIKRMANSQQKIVTRLRALGSTKNLPYRYYNKKYASQSPDLSQTLFPTNLQLPDTFAPPSTKETNNAERDRLYGINELSGLPYIRHVKGDTNDAYIDKNDDASSCAEGIREDSARWDGTNGDLPEIYPTIEEATYNDLRGAMVEDQDGNTGVNSFPNYGGDERIDELLAVGFQSDGVMVNDANKGDGILPEGGISDSGVPKSATIGQTGLIYNTNNGGDFTSVGGYLFGTENILFSIQDVKPGNYIMAPTIGAVFYGFTLSCYNLTVAADVGFRIIIRQKSKVTGNTTVLATYTSDLLHTTCADGLREMELPEIPDVKNGSNAKVQNITVTDLSEIIVSFTPIMQNVSVPSGFTDDIALVYKIGNSRLGNGNNYSPEYTWKSLDDNGDMEEVFHVFIKDMGFDITACWTDETPVMSMKSGKCVGRDFEIGDNVQKVTYNGKKGYLLTLKRVTDNSLNTYYPNSIDTLSAGDRFVLLNISMPDVYVRMAEVRLLRAATDYLADNSETQFTYQPYIDDIYLQRNLDKCRANGREQDSIFWRLYAGLKFTFFGIPASEDDPLPLIDLTIERVSIQMGEGLTPKVEMTLNDDVQQTTLQKLTTSVDRIYNGSLFASGGGSGTGANAAALLGILQNEGGKLYLSKKYDDVAEGKITFNDVDTHNATSKFNEGLKVGNFQSRFLGSGAIIDKEGNAEFESIYSRNFISTPEFRFNRIAVTEGEQWCTNGFGTIKEVDVLSETTGRITLKLEENDYASVKVGDICRGIYNDIENRYETATLDDDSNFYGEDAPEESEEDEETVTNSEEGTGIGFSCKSGFFTSYFCVTSMVVNKRGECVFEYRLRNTKTPHPCAFMKFAQYGSFTDSSRRSSSFSTSIGHYYEMVLDGVSTWKIQSENVVYRKGYLGNMTITLKDGREAQLQGYGLYVQDNVYFGNAIVQLDPRTIAELQEQLKFYDVSLTEYIDVITVDDVGNVIGGLYTQSGENNQYRTYRIHSSIMVRKNGVLLTLAADEDDADVGTYKFHVEPHGCTCVIQDSTIYITGIDNIKDGVPGSPDDVNFDYNAMRNMGSCSVDIVVDCEGKGAITKQFPITIKHDSQPFVGADITNEFSGVSWNTRTQQYVGLPITFDMKMWHNNEVLDIANTSDVSLSTSTAGVTLVNGTAPATPAASSIYYTKTIATIVVNQGQSDQYSYKVARINITAMGADVPLVTNINVTCVATYSGIQYERTLVHTINKSTDTNVYSLLPSVSEVVVNKNTGTPSLSEDLITCSVICDSSDDKHYTVNYADFATHGLVLYYRKHYTDGTQDQNETLYTNTAISIDSSVEKVAFFLYGYANGSVDRTTIHDSEEVPVIATGQDGKGVEYIFFQQNTETPKPTINDVASRRQQDNYCPLNTEGSQQWTDEPVGVGVNSKFEFYAQRKKENGVWQPFGTVKLWNRYTIDGVSPYMLDLSNEQSFVNCNTNGTVVGSYETSRVMLFKGTSYAFTDFNIRVTPTNITCNSRTSYFELSESEKTTAQSNGYFTLTPSVITANSAQITVQATLKTNSSIVLVAVYKINKNIAGGEGLDAVMYSLIPSLNVIHKSNGSFTDYTLSVQVKKTVGTTSTILSTYQAITNEGLSLYYSASGGSETQLQAVSISTSTFVGVNGTYGILKLKDSSNVVVDSERINVVSDGQDGEDGQDGDDGIVFKLVPSISTVSFSRGSDGVSLTPSSVQLSCGYTKTEGKTLTPYSGTVQANLWTNGGAPYNIMYRFKYADGSYNPASGYQWSKDLSGGLLTIPNSTSYIAIEFIMTSASSSYHYSSSYPGGVRAENIIDAVTVDIKKDGQKGEKGDKGDPGDKGDKGTPIYIRDRGIYKSGEQYWYAYNSGISAYIRDMMRYEISGVMYGFLAKQNEYGYVTDPPTSASGDTNWESAGIVNTVIANTIFGTNANIGGFMASAQRLRASAIAYRAIYKGVYSSSTGYSNSTVTVSGVTLTTRPVVKRVVTENGVQNTYYYTLRASIGTTVTGQTPSANSTYWREATETEVKMAASSILDSYVDIAVLEINGVDGLIEITRSDDSIWRIEDNGLQVLGIEGGRRVELDPSSQAINIFNDNGQLCTTISGESVSSISALFGNSSGTFSVDPASGSRSVTNMKYGSISVNTEKSKGAYEIASYGTTLTQNSRITATGSISASALTTQNNTSSGYAVSDEPYVQHFASISIYVYTYTDNTKAILTKKTLIASISSRGQGVKSLTSFSRSIEVPAGRHSIFVEWECDAYPTTQANVESLVTWSNFAASFVANTYLSRYLANGFAFGSSANNFFAALNESNKMKLSARTIDAASKISGFDFNTDGFSIMRKGISSPLFPTLLYALVTYTASSNTFSINPYFRFDGFSGVEAFTVASESGGVNAQINFPTTFRNLNLSYNNTIVTVTAFNRECYNAHIAAFTSSYITIECNDDDTQNKTSFFIEMKYIG